MPLRLWFRLWFQGSHTKRYQGGTAQKVWRFTEGDVEAVCLTQDWDGTSRRPMWWRGRVYFVSDRDGTMNIWSMTPGINFDTQPPLQVTAAKAVGVEDGVRLSWTPPTASTDIRGYQVLCASAMDNQPVFLSASMRDLIGRPMLCGGRSRRQADSFLQVIRAEFAGGAQLHDHGAIFGRHEMREASRDDDETARGVALQLRRIEPLAFA